MERAHEITNNKVRVQFDLLPARIEEIENLMAVCGIETRKDLVNNALTLLEWAVDTVRKGQEVAALDKQMKHYEVLRMPILNAAAKYGREMNTVAASEVYRRQLAAVDAESGGSSAQRPAPLSLAALT